MLFRSGLVELISSLGLVSKIVLLILLVFSIGSWTVILYKWRFFRRQEAADLRFLKTYRRYEYPLKASRELHLHRDSSVAAVFAEVARCYQLGGNGNPGTKLAIERVGDGEAGLPTQRYVERILAHAIQEQITRTETDLPFLATTGNITPFIGLLGTVLGIIDAFREIGVQGTASISAVAPGVAEALVATAAGLFTAIPAVIAYNYFLVRVRRMAFQMDRFAIELTNALEMRGIQEDARRP
ncbi:MAG TPA: MotA/TolQ/ExbB proton channel family protein [Nitrospirales bacterium]|nr:MotA/TolQ/ExbB proton channel family protein [Nitrospirales bacterium]